MPAEFADLDFEHFHREELPQRLASERRAEMAARAVRAHGALAFRLGDGAAWSYVPRDGGVDLVPGVARADTIVDLEHDAWQGLVHDLESPPGLLYAGRAKSGHGDLMRFVFWEPALRAMFHGIPVYDPAHPDLRDAAGRVVDPRRAFRLDEDSEDEIAAFLDVAGYVLLKGVFSREEVEDLRAGADVLRERAREGDRESWWGRDRAGEAILCRVLRAGALPVFRGLPDDPRVQRIARLSGRALAHRDPEGPNGVTVLWKNPDMTEGLSDLPWHRDCGMGGHAIMCPTMVLSTYLDAATEAAGELRFLPASWRCTYGFASVTDGSAPIGVAVAAEPGDVTLHYGDGMHAAPPPKGRSGPFRRSVLIGFSRPGARHHRGENHYNDVLLGRDDGQVEHLEHVARRG